MEYQPNEVPPCTSDDQTFYQYDAILFANQSQSVNSTSRDDSNTTLPSSVQSAEDPFNNHDATSPGLNGQPTIPSTPNNAAVVVVEELSPGQAFLVIHDCPEPDNEVTVSTTPSDVDESNMETVADTSSEPDLNDLKKHAEEENLKRIDESIVERTMRVKTHPPAYVRLRYWSDGPRQLAKSLKDPMAIDLPNIKNIKLNSAQSFWIRLLPAAWMINLPDEVYLHPNKLEYHSDDVIKFPDGTIGVRLTADDIKKGIKVFSRLQILKTKLGTYYREFTPLDRFGIASDIDGNETVPVSEAKKMFDEFNLKAMWIVCQLLVEQNETFHFTDIICVTDKIEEIKQQNKRAVKIMKVMKNKKKSKSTKQKKISH